MPSLTGPQMKQLVEAILDGFDLDSMQQMLLYEMNVQLNHIAGDGPFRQVVFQVIQWVGARGLTPDLLSALERTRPRNSIVLKAVADLRMSLGIMAASTIAPTHVQPLVEPKHELDVYPKSGMVRADVVPLSFIAVFSQLYPTSDAVFRAVAAANQMRRSADPDDAGVRTIDQGDIPNPAVAGPNGTWTNILLQACRGGPRLLAALLHSAPADAFGQDREKFLKDLKQVGS